MKLSVIYKVHIINPLSGVESDDDEIGNDDDFLYIKRKNHELDIKLPVSENENTSTSKKPRKLVTKVAVAKKMLKKKILPNKKIVFDEDGEVRMTGRLDY